MPLIRAHHLISLGTRYSEQLEIASQSLPGKIHYCQSTVHSSFVYFIVSVEKFPVRTLLHSIPIRVHTHRATARLLPNADRQVSGPYAGISVEGWGFFCKCGLQGCDCTPSGPPSKQGNQPQPYPGQPEHEGAGSLGQCAAPAFPWLAGASLLRGP